MPLDVRGERDAAVREGTVQLARWLASEEERVELLVAWRLEPLIATRAKPAVACGVVHCAQHVRRQQRVRRCTFPYPR